MSLFVALAYLTLSLKLDQIGQIQWNVVFWWYWIAFGFFITLTLVNSLILANHFLSIAFGDQNLYSIEEVKQLFWCLIYSLTGGLLSHIWIRGIEDLYDDGSYFKLYISLGIIGFFQLLFAFFTLYWKLEVTNFFYKIIYEELKESINNKDKDIIVKRRAPKFLQKLSDGYYKVIKISSKILRLKITGEPQTLNQQNTTIFDSNRPTNSRTSKRVSDLIVQQTSSLSSQSQIQYQSKIQSNKRIDLQSEALQQGGEEEKFKVSQEEKALCLICFERSPDSVFMPCGHGGCCNYCALLIWKTQKLCFLCRTPVQLIFKVNQYKNNPNLVTVVRTYKSNEDCLMVSK